MSDNLGIHVDEEIGIKWIECAICREKSRWMSAPNEQALDAIREAGWKYHLGAVGPVWLCPACAETEMSETIDRKPYWFVCTGEDCGASLCLRINPLWPYAAAKVRAHALGWRCCNDDEGWLCPECYRARKASPLSLVQCQGCLVFCQNAPEEELLAAGWARVGGGSEGWLCPECARRRKPARKTEGLRKALANLESEIARLEEES